jgi:hypothetical protein
VLSNNFNFNVHHYLLDFGASLNVMPHLFFQKINDVLEKRTTRIIQLDRSDVKVIGELKDVMIRLDFDLRVHQVIDIIVVDIPKAYGLLWSRDWSAKLQGYFSTNWTHFCLPYKGRINQIRETKNPT